MRGEEDPSIVARERERVVAGEMGSRKPMQTGPARQRGGHGSIGVREGEDETQPLQAIQTGDGSSFVRNCSAEYSFFSFSRHIHDG